MRLDRSITLGLVHPLRRVFRTLTPQPLPLNRPVPILMYHSISDEPEPGVPAYYQTNTSPAVFRQHMQFLADQGYRTINLDQLVSWLTKGGEVSAFQDFSFSAFPKPVVLTFDDGFRNFYTDAFPVLQNHGFTVTVFLPTAFIRASRPVQGSRFDGSGFKVPCHFPFRNPHCEFLTWNEVRELRQAGIQFGSHTVNHPKLVELSWSGIQSELSNSKSDIEQHLGEPVSAFCYPFAFPQTDRSFANSFRDLVLQTGYSCCTTTELGRVHPGSDPFRLKRLPANALDDNALLAAKLEGAYDWLAAPQSIVKTIKAFLRPQPSARKAVPAAGAPSNPSRLVGSAEQ
jgi:peptidoglycan/xylan/chitin deacetylase (PgdA/CDA1 family)